MLLAEWDWEKNALNPFEVVAGSVESCWWKCSTCGHSWRTVVYSRTNAGTACPECAKIQRGIARSRTAAQKNNFVKKFPQIAKEWHPTKNGLLTAEDVSAFSNKKVWWQCAVCGEEWQTTVSHRSKENNGCPQCAKIKRGKTRTYSASRENNFETKFPELAAEWHPTKNGELTPKNISVSCNRKVWWQCSYCGYDWQDTPNHRTQRGSGCPHCTKGQTSVAEQSVYFYVKQVFPNAVHRYNEDFEFDIYLPTESIAVEYDGYRYHQSQKTYEKDCIKDEYCLKKGIRLIRFRESRLPDTPYAERITMLNEYHIESAIKRLFELLPSPSVPDINLRRDGIRIREQFRQIKLNNSLAVKSPQLLAEWHSTKNGYLLPTAIPAFSNAKLWWHCSVCGYDWQDTASHRSSGRGCPLCAGRVVVEGVNDLQTFYPALAQEWNFERNEVLLPTMVSAKSNKRVWWRCRAHGHEWQAVVSERTREGRETNCPYCGNKKVLAGFNDLATTHPQLLNEWDYEKNDAFLPTQVTAGAHKRVWWICSKCEHKWEAIIYSRAKGYGCPRCGRKAAWETRKRG